MRPGLTVGGRCGVVPRMASRRVSRRAMVFIVVTGSVTAAMVAGLALRSTRGGEDDEREIATDSVVMLGDSITEQGRWASLLPRWPVVNHGHAGFTTAELLPAAHEIATAGPSVVFILTGTNDIRDGHPAAWTIEHLRKILDAFQSTAPHTAVVVQTILPRGDARRAVDLANAAIRDEASGRGLRVLDLHVAFDDGNGALRADETSDGVHLATAGYDRWAALLERELAALA